MFYSFGEEVTEGQVTEVFKEDEQKLEGSQGNDKAETDEKMLPELPGGQRIGLLYGLLGVLAHDILPVMVHQVFFGNSSSEVRIMLAEKCTSVNEAKQKQSRKTEESQGND